MEDKVNYEARVGGTPMSPEARAEFLSRRRGGIYGSDAAVVLGISPWQTRLQLYMDKRGLLPETQETEAMSWGTRLEPVVREAYQDQTGRKVRPCGPILTNSHGFPMGAHLDGLQDVDGKRYVVEIKTSYRGWNGVDDLPDYYYAQVQHYIACADQDAATVVVLAHGSQLRWVDVERDQPFIDALIAAEKAFWHGHVVAEVPPDPTADDLGVLPAMYPKKTEDLLPMTPNVRELIDERVAWAKTETEAK